MRKLIRAILFIITLVVVLAVAGIVVAILFTDKAVKTMVEKAGTKTLNVGVQVGKANASLLSGAVSCRTSPSRIRPVTRVRHS